MATFGVDFLGCKVSHTDAQALRERLVADGHVETGEAADIAVLNTCCVTHEAVRKSRQAARRAAAGRPDLRHGLRRQPRGRCVLGPAGERAGRSAAERADSAFVAGVGRIGCVQADVGLDRVRAFVKIQDGCGFTCSYCVIPQVRGASQAAAQERSWRRSGGVSDRGTGRSF